MSLWYPANDPVSYPVNDGQPRHRPRHSLIEGPTEAISPAAVALAAGVTRLPQLEPAPPALEPVEVEDAPVDTRGGWGGLLPVGGALTMASLASYYVGIEHQPAFGWATLIVMVGFIAAFIAWGWRP